MTEKVVLWQQNYDTLIKQARREPFRWGEHDCVMFAAKALDAQYDLGLVAVIHTHFNYYDEETALEVINDFTDLEALVSSVLGVDPLPPAHLTVGDAVLYDYGSIEFPHALAVHDGHQLLAPTLVGLVVVPLDKALKGWRP